MDPETTAQDKQYAPVIGVDLGGTKILAAVIDPTGGIIASEKKKTKAHKPWREVISRIAKCSRKAVKKAGYTMDSIGALGIGAPGALNPREGVIHLAPNLHWEEVPLKKVLEKELGIPVFINNDVNIGTLGEFRMGSALGMTNVVGIFVGTGIGGGLIFNGKIYEGSSFMAGEIGHIPLVEDGPECGCGNKGCFEAAAGRLAIIRDIQKAVKKGKKTSLKKEKGGDLSKIKSGLLAKAWEEEDKLVTDILKKAAFQIGRGVATVINLLNPDAVVLGGGLIEALDDKFIKQIKKSAEKHSFPSMYKKTSIVPAVLGDDAGIIGAAIYARDRLKESD